MSERYAGRIRFVGYQQEFDKWTAEFGHTAEYQPVVNALDMANRIAGAELFIGNQTFAMALALALNVPLIQETSPVTADCIFNRPNAVYSIRSPIKLPDLKPTMRPVINRPNREGLIELGPCADAYGLGDTLTITPLATVLGKKAVMLMPEKMRGLSFIFNGLCQLRFTDNYPIFPWLGGKHAAAQKLSAFGFHATSPIPAIKLRPEAIEKAKVLLQGFPSPVAFCPTCSRTWEHVRQRPPLFWKPIIAELSKRYTVCQFGRLEYPLVEGAARMPFAEVETLAAMYHLIGNLVSVNTGDYHLMLAVGGRCVVVEPEPLPNGHAISWDYQTPRIVYAKLSHPQTVLDAIKKLPL